MTEDTMKKPGTLSENSFSVQTLVFAKPAAH